MGTIAFTDGRLYVGGSDLSGHTNSGTLTLDAAELDASSIKDGWDVTVIGRKSAEINAAGFWEAGAGMPDGMFALLGSANQVVTILPDGDDGGTGYAVQAVPVKYALGGGAGDLLPFSVTAKGDISRAIRGTVMHDDTVARTASGTGVIRQLGAVGSTQRVYASLHVIAASGTSPTLDVIVQSAASVGFGSPTTRLTFTQKTGTAGEWQSALGPITDQYWRVSYTIGGTSPSFTFVVLVAIL